MKTAALTENSVQTFAACQPGRELSPTSTVLVNVWKGSLWGVLLLAAMHTIVHAGPNYAATVFDPATVAGGDPGAVASAVHGRNLFFKQAFGGNGRTCASCHGAATGTISPEEVQDRLVRAAFPPRGRSTGGGDPLFRAIDSDDGLGVAYNRLLEHATVRVGLLLPGHLVLEAAPAVREVVVNRGVPSTIDSGLLSVLMHDGRAPDLETQALDAILGHAEATRLPSEQELGEIAAFERTQFSRPELAAMYATGVTAELPPGVTPEEIRGRRHIAPGGLCAVCHDGPMLNRTSALHPAGAGVAFESILVSERNRLRNPVYTFAHTRSDGSVRRVVTPDPGLALIENTPIRGLRAVGPMNFFRIPSLWNVQNTAPYFHDNSAKNLDEVMEQYRRYFPPNILTDEMIADIIAYLKLL